MDDMSTRLGKLGQTAAHASDQAADPPGTIAAARRRLLAAPASGQRFGRRARWGMAAGLAAACAVAAWVWSNRPAALSFHVGWPPERRQVGEWIAAAPEADLPVRFSEGSVLTLAPGARVRVTEANAEGAGVLIEQGSIHAKIEHTGHNARWTLRAGPFEVRVIGTVFNAKWDPAAEVFELSMKEGAVVAAGPLLPSDRTIVAGERLVISIRDQRMELRNAREPLGAAPPESHLEAHPLPQAAAAAPVESVAASAEPPPQAAGSAGASNAEPTAVPSWRALAAAGKYKDALQSAERAGFSAEVARASATDLLALADAARFAGSPARAREALLAARSRFGARGRSAFLLGKIAADQQGAYGDAVLWFETYLREEPGGSLAEQALGRIVDIHSRSNPASARAAAERYLARYPKGAYASVARRVLSP